MPGTYLEKCFHEIKKNEKMRKPRRKKGVNMGFEKRKQDRKNDVIKAENLICRTKISIY